MIHELKGGVRATFDQLDLDGSGEIDAKELRALFSMLGCIVRPHEPDEFYNAGEKDNVQNSQMVAVITGWIGATGPLVAALLKEHVPTPGEQLLGLHSHFKGDGAPPLTPGIQLKDGIEA